MRILLVEQALRENGGLRVNLSLAKLWTEGAANVRVFVVQQVAAGQLATVDERLPVEFGVWSRGRFRFSWPLALARLLRACRRASIVVSGSEIGNGLLLGFLAARLTRRPFLVIVHASPNGAITQWVPPPLRAATRWVLGHADAAVCVCEPLVPEMRSVGMAPDRVFTVGNGIDVDAVRALAEKPPVMARDGRPLVVAVGRLSGEKGFDVLVRAHASVRRAGLDHRLVIVGEGPERAALMHLARRLGIDDSVRFPGFLANPHAVVGRADLYVQPSRYEAMSLSLFEALAVGVPIIASDCEGPREVLASGRYGELVPVDSEAALADAIAQHLRDPRRLRGIAADGPARARHFDLSRSAAEYLTIFAQVARENPREAARRPPPEARAARPERSLRSGRSA